MTTQDPCSRQGSDAEGIATDVTTAGQTSCIIIRVAQGVGKCSMCHYKILKYVEESSRDQNFPGARYSKYDKG